MMNPILDMITAVPNAESQLTGGTPTNGEASGGAVFAQVLSAAITSTPQKFSLPAAGIQIPVKSGAEPVLAGTDLATMLMMSALDRGTDAESTASTPVVVSDLMESGDIAVEPRGQIQIDSLPVDAAAAAADAMIAVTAIVDPLAELANRMMPLVMGPAADDKLQSRIESQLLTLTNQQPNGIVIAAQVEISDDAAKALTQNFEKPKGESVTIQNVGEASEPATATTKPVTTLKADLRKAFPTVNIESATGKVNVQMKLNEMAPEAQQKAETSAAKPTVASNDELPIAVAPQMATTVVVSGVPNRTMRISRDTKVDNSIQTKNIVAGSADQEPQIRPEQRVSIRKPVLQALKSQGFDVEKLMILSSKSPEQLVESTTFDKPAVTATADKPIMPPADRSFELNGTERFRLDIKRGHIDTLLKKGEIRLQLQPEQLGSLKIRLITTPTEVNARMETSSEEARRSVEMSLPQLRESFERAGLKLNSIEVSVNDNNSNRQQAFQQEWRGRNSAARMAAMNLVADIPAAAEISHNPLSAYGGALNLVA